MYEAHALLALLHAMGPEGGDRFGWLIGTIRKMTCEDGTEDLVWPISSQWFGVGAPWANRHLKTSVLAELGRIVDAYSNGAEVAVKWADELCHAEPKLSVKEAVRRLRQWRLNLQATPADAKALYERLIDTLNLYENTHTGLTYDLILEALGYTENYVELFYSPDEDDPEDRPAASEAEISESASETQEDAPC
jgi:hypothetical protein